MVGNTSRAARGLLGTLIAGSMTLAACGGGDTTSPTADAESAPTTDSAVNTTAASEPSGTTTSQPMTETTATGSTEAASAATEVDATALPADPSGCDTWYEDLCTLDTVEQLDSYFVGKGDLTTTEPLDRGCRWAVEGFPRSHYVDIAHGPSDIVAMIPTPDGSFLKVLIHGSFDAPSGPLGSYLDDAAAGLAENIVSRF